MSSFLYKKKMGLVPETVLALLLEKNPGYVALAAVSDGQVQLNTEATTVAGINAIQNVFKEDEVFMLFSEGKPVNGEDRQPFVLLKYPVGETEMAPALVVFSEADHSQFNQADSSFSDAYHMMQEDLGPWIMTLSQACDGDLAKLMSLLGTDASKKKIERLWIGRGTLCFVGAIDDVDHQSLMYSMNELKRDFDWGCVSNMYDVAGESVALPPTVVTKGKSMSAALAAQPPAGPSVPLVPGKPTLALPPSKKTDTKVPDSAASPAERWHPPVGLTGAPLKAEIRAFNREHFGHNKLPDNWAEIPKLGLAYPAGKGKVIKSLGELPQPPGVRETSAVGKPVNAPKPPAPKEPLLIEEAIWNAVQDDFISKFDFTKKTLDASGKSITDPESIQSIEAKRPTFVDKVGLGDIEDILGRIDDESAEYLMCKYPKPGAVLLMDVVRKLIAAEREVNELLVAEKPKPAVAQPPRKVM
jgi:hypothetical protein